MPINVENLRLSVVIRTFNSAKTLESVLASLDLKEEDEVITVDSGSSDTTLEIARRFGAKIVQAPPPFNYSKSLNLGFKASNNPWVLVLSSHAIPISDNFLDLVRNEVAVFPEDVVVGYAPATFTGKSDARYSQETTFFSSKDRFRAAEICGNGNTIYRKSSWASCAFDETVRTSEDKIWLLTMLDRGYRFGYLPLPRCLSRNQATLTYMFRKGYSDARALRGANHKPIAPWFLGGAIKNILKSTFAGELDWGSCIRCMTHAFGQFIGSWRSENNSPDYQ